jgi:hypothetical protein
MASRRGCAPLLRLCAAGGGMTGHLFPATIRPQRRRRAEWTAPPQASIMGGDRSWQRAPWVALGEDGWIMRHSSGRSGSQTGFGGKEARSWRPKASTAPAVKAMGWTVGLLIGGYGGAASMKRERDSAVSVNSSPCRSRTNGREGLGDMELPWRSARG